MTDVKFTENRNDGGDPTSIEFDNIVLGTAAPAPTPPTVTPFLTPVTLDDAALISSGQLPLVSSDQNVFSKSSFYEYGSIAANGFTITNLDRSDFAFSSYDLNFASINTDTYDGPDVLSVPFSQISAPSTVQI